MKVLLIGSGVMSNFLEESIKEKGYELVGKIDIFGNGDFNSFDNISKDFDIIIDFSHHSLIKNVLNLAKKNNVNLLIGTTGHNTEELEAINIASNEIAILKSTNTSFGVNALNKIVAYASKILKDFDIEIIEKHHNRKIDAPSGTANTLLKVIEESLDNEFNKVYGRENKKREKNEIGIHSIRAGSIVGEHSILFSKGDEIIELKHSALSRKIFSDGAVSLLEKLKEKEKGYFEMGDFI